MPRPSSRSAAESLWQATAAPVEPRAQLRGALGAQVAVIGAGYTGLSAALYLCDAGCDVVVLEAGDVGEGASGRNGGQVIPGLKYDPDTLEAMFGSRLGPKLVATIATAADRVFELIRKHDIQCAAVRTGWLQLAARESALSAIEARVRQWQARGADVQLLDRTAAARLSGTQRYHGGWIDRRAGTIHPLDYVRGLAAAAARRGVRVFTHSAAVRAEKRGAEWLIHTGAGTLRSAQVIVATNAYGNALFAPLQKTFVAVPSMQVATAPLPPELRASILPQGQSVSDTWRLLRYFRMDPSGRLVMGSRGVFGDVALTSVAGLHYRAVRDLYPQLAGIRFDHHWCGDVAMTPDHLPHLHEVAPGVLAGLGYNGRGVAMATTMGMLLARRLLGESADDIGFPITPLRPMPMHRFSRVGAAAAIHYLRALDGVSRFAEKF